MYLKRETLTAPGMCPFLNSSGGRTSKIRAPLLLLPEEEEEEEEEAEEEGKSGSDDRSEEGSRPAAALPLLSLAKTSSCGEMCLASLARSVFLISSQALGEVGRDPAMSRPDSPRSFWGEAPEEVDDDGEKARIVFCRSRWEETEIVGLRTAGAGRPLLGMQLLVMRGRCVTEAFMRADRQEEAARSPASARFHDQNAKKPRD